jgi:hypothetical protein
VVELLLNSKTKIKRKKRNIPKLLFFLHFDRNFVIIFTDYIQRDVKMSGSERFLSQNILRPSALNGNISTTTQCPDYGFTPIAMVPPLQNQFSPRPVRPVPTCAGFSLNNSIM